MQFSGKYRFGIGTFAFALVLMVSHANAQRATFTLPFEAHVGNATLEPGEYRLRLPAAETNMRDVVLEGNGKVQRALPITTDSGPQSAQAYFEFVNVDGTYFAKKFVSGATGTTYEFHVPKPARRSVVANSHTTSVSVSGGVSN